MSESDPLGLVGSTIDELRFDECVDTEGSGLVYRGKLAGREGAVAIKCLSLSRLGAVDVTARAEIASRFSSETKILRKLGDGTHDIVHCITSGMLSAPTTNETVQYQVLEWLDGRTLKVDLTERRSRGMPGRSLRETMDMLEGAALAMGHAHSLGIIHRHLEPSNLMLTRIRGALRLKVLDFGLAQILGQEAGLRTEVAPVFSEQYSAPEQLTTPPGDVGPWTDVFSLALVMLEILHGAPAPNPRAGAIRASALGVTVPAPIEELLALATAVDPHARPADATVFWTKMREVYKETAKPLASAEALAATAIDDDAAAAIARVRAMTAAGGTPQSDKGTVLMAGAPPTPKTPAAPPAQDAALTATAPLGVPSPLATSLGGNMQTPLARKAPSAPAAPTATTTPPVAPVSLPVPAQKSPALLIGVLTAVIVLVGIVAVVLMMKK
ncbi:MAG: protein kinase [Labilithrix sp.]|nr:protein kinase [Labilithrix sp.]MCW5809597.1 protein kinase [Labilithrix sp.]